MHGDANWSSMLVELHESIREEMENRGIVHLDYRPEDNLETLIKDIENYNPKELDTRVLQDDWRIVNAWYSSIKKGREFKYTKEQVIDLATRIARELVERGITFHPDRMKPNARELYEIVKKRLREEGIEPVELKLKLPVDITMIDDRFVSKLTDEELKQLHEWLHKEWSKVKDKTGSVEDYVNAHVFIHREMQIRGIRHENVDSLLDALASHIVSEYPPATLEKEEVIRLEDFLNDLPSHIPLEEPYIWVVGGIVNRGSVTEGHDIDIYVRRNIPDQNSRIYGL